MASSTGADRAHFDPLYQSHLKHLKLKGLRPKTIDAYSRAIRRVGAFSDHRIESLSEAQLVDYFTQLLDSHSWSSVKLDLYGLQFFTRHVLKKPLVAPDLIKPPKRQRWPNIVSLTEAQRIFAGTRVLQLPGVLLHSLQHGAAAGRGLAIAGQRHRRRACAGAYPRCQGQ